MPNPQKRPINISLPVEMIREAKELGLNMSKACEKGLVAELSVRRQEKWLAENGPKIEAWNNWVDEHGMPLSEFRQL